MSQKSAKAGKVLQKDIIFIIFLMYAAIHQLGGQAGKYKSVEIPARPYSLLTDSDYDEILHNIEKYLHD